MTVTFQALWMVCALATPVFAAAARAPRDLALLAAAFTAGVGVLHPDRLPCAESVALVGFVGALVSLTWARFAWVGMLSGGVLAAVWVRLLQFQGLPVSLALGMVLLVAVCAIWQTWRRAVFAPDRLRDEALAIVAGLTLALAVFPGVADGWQSAVVMNVEAETALSATMPLWVSIIAALALACGVAHSVWSRR